MEKTNKKYSKETLDDALHAIRNGMSYKNASVQFKIPKTTLIDKIKKKYQNDKVGAPTILTNEEEQHLVKWIDYLGQSGFPVTKSQLFESVSKLVKSLNRPNKFKDGIPGRHWYEGFQFRHPELSERVSQNLTKPRAEVSEEMIRAWFHRVESFFSENNYMNILSDPKRIFNCDETGFYLAPKEKQVIVRKGSRKVYNRIQNDEKECLTVLLTANAAGDLPPPLVLFPYKRMPVNIISKMPLKWGLGRSESGWMTSENFYEYVTNIFYPWLQENNISFPIVLFLDGHSSHLNLPLTEFCKTNGIILTALLPNSTHLIQPLDVAVFKPVKQSWKEYVHKWRLSNQGEKLKREDFANLLKECLDHSCTEQIIKKGFESCGLFPFNENRVDYTKCIKLSPSKTFCQTQTNVISKCTCDNDYAFLFEFKSRIDPEVLKIFKNNENGFNGGDDRSLEGLFNFWKSIKRCPKIHITSTEQANNRDGADASAGDKSLGLQTLDDSAHYDHDITLENNLDQDKSCASTLANIQIDDSIWLENSNTLNLDVLPNGSVRIVDAKNDTAEAGSQEESNERVTNIIDCNDIPETNNLKENECSFVSNRKLNEDQLRTIPENESKIIYANSTSPLKEIPSAQAINENETPDKKLIPIKIPTPFKKSLFWPSETKHDIKSQQAKNNNKLVIKKKTPTVAISDEYIEYQRRIEDAKKKKLNEKIAKANKRKIVNEISKAEKKSKVNSKEELTLSSREEPDSDSKRDSECKLYSIGDYVIVLYEGDYFPGIIIADDSETKKIKSMSKSGFHWKWPEKDDILDYLESDIVCKINNPIAMNKRGQYDVPELKEKNVST